MIYKKKLIWIGVIAVIFLASVVIINSLHQTKQGKVAQSTSTNPQDVVPGLYPNPIKNDATTVGFTIKSGMVENNTDPVTGKVVSDHLELQLVNTTKADISNFEVYYTITDTKTGQKEGYYKKLTGFSLKAGATTTVHFDSKPGDGHFTANTNSLYYKSTNALDFAVQVSAPTYTVQTIQLAKAAGGAETKD